jgi:hypothetical protein
MISDNTQAKPLDKTTVIGSAFGNFMKTINKNCVKYPYISFDMEGSLFLSKVDNKTLNENRNKEFYSENTLIIGSSKNKENLFFINETFKKLITEKLVMWNGSFSTDAFNDILMLLKDMRKDEKFKKEILSLFDDVV